MPAPLRLAAFYFAYFAYGGAYMPYFPVFLAGRGLDAREIALVLALPQLARLVAPAFWGWLADRTGAHRAIVVGSCAAIALCFAVLPAVQGVAALAAVVALMSLLSAGALPLVEAITLGSLAGAGRYGPIRLWGSVGFIAAVLLIGLWLDAHPASTLPGLLVGLALAALVCALFLPAGQAHARAAVPMESLPREPAVPVLFAVGCLMAMAHGALYAFYTLHLERLGYSGAAIGTLWTLGVLAEIVVFLYLPVLFRRFTLSSILAASCLIAAVRFAAIGVGADHLRILVIAQLMHAATFGAFHAASVAAVQKLFPRAQARGQALFSSLCYGAGAAAGSLLAGWAWERHGPELAFGLSAAAGLLGAGLALSLRKRL